MMKRLLQKIRKKKELYAVLLIFIFVMNTVCGSNVYVSAARDKTAPSIPQNLQAVSITDNSVSLTWSASTDNVKVSYYEIYRNSSKIGTAVTASYQVNGLTPSTTYKFCVRARDAVGNSSGYSSTLTVTTLQASTLTPAPTVAPIATPTTVPVITPTAVPTPTPVATLSATPTPTAMATATPAPTAIATATPSPTTAPIATPAPTATPTPVPAGSRVIGYYAAWAAYSGFTPDKVDVSKLTHINYAFANIGSDLKIALGYPDVDTSNISKLNALKQINPNLKTLISVGGWEWSGRFSDAALTDASRTTFADSCVAFLVKYGFDGIDIDWEYPVAGGLSTNIRRAEDKTNFTLLMQKLREKLDARGVIDGKHYLLTFAGAAGSWYIKNIEPAKLMLSADYVNVMTYDLHGNWDTYTDFNAPLYTNSDVSPQYKDSVDGGITAWINTGIPKNQIVMGVPFYGYIYKAVPNINHGLYQTYSGGSSISYANVAGNYLNATGYVKYFHSQSLVPWLFNGSTFISYEDAQSMGYKAQYIKTKGLGGAMIWELSQDPNRVLLDALYQDIQ